VNYSDLLRLFATSEQTTEKIIFTSCTHRDDSDCENCKNKDRLDCKWERKLLLRFMYVMLPAFFFGFGGIVIGAVYTGWWWRLGATISYLALFFIVETRILCSHCPYYAEDGKILHCLANHGFFKYARYHPEPLNLFEKTLLVIGFILFGVCFPLAQVYSLVIVVRGLASYSLTILAVLAVILALTVISVIIAFTLLFTRICPNCVNFSCPFNSVPKEFIDAYLEQNPEMKEAWLEKGYKMSDQ